MARQVLPIVGAVAGFVITGGNPAGAQFGFAIGSLVGNAVDPIEMQGRKLGDSPTQVAAEGGARAIVYGNGCIRATCILERGGRRVIKQRDRSGGKGGGPTTINERALWTFAIGLGEPVAAILRIWENEKLVYDVTPDSTIPEDTAQFSEKFRFYTGAEDQLPDPALEALHGVGNTPYYRGTAYMVFPQYDLTDFGETVPTYRVEVASVAETLAIQLMAFRSGSLASSYMVINPSWAGSWVDDLDLVDASQYAIEDEGRILAYHDSNPVYTDDQGATFVVSGGSPASTSGGTLYGWMDGDTVLLPGGVDVMRLSLDRGETFSAVPGSPFSNAVAKVGRWLSLYHGSGGIRWASNPAGPWSAETPTGLDIGFQPCRWSSGGSAMFGGSFGGVPAAFTTVNGEDLFPQTLPTFVSAQNVTCITEHEGTWVIGTDSGEIAYRTGGLWTLSPDNLGVACRDVTHNGSEFVMIGGNDSDGDTHGFIKSSPTGHNWTTRFTDPLTSGEWWTAIVPAVSGAVESDTVTLANVIAALHQRAGHTSADYNVTELTDQMIGVVIESTVTGAEGINSIIGSHFADPSDYDGSIHYIKRGKPVILTLTEDDLIDEPDQAQRNNAIEYPRKVHFLGQRADLAYASSKSTSARYSDDAKVVGEITIGSPETYDDPESPATIAVKLHKVLWTEAEGEREWQIPDNYLGLVPTDNVGLSYRGELVRCRILQVEDTPGQRKLRMIRDRQSAYTANLAEIPNPPSPTPPQSSVVAPTVMAFIDTSALTDNADTLHYLVALSGANDNWAGAVLQQQLSGNFTSIDSTTINSIMGTLLNTVTDAAPWYTDTTNTAVVRLFTDDELESRTDAEFLSNGGAFFLSWTDSGQTNWEIMQFRDAVQDSNGDWVLSHFLRGRKNTETAEHPPGAVFVWIDPAILREAAQTSWINTTLTHRAVSNGQSPELAVIQNNYYTGNSQREWPVANLLLSRPDADTVAAEAIPRHRFGTSMNPIRSINWEGYRWTATDGANTISRDGTGDTESFDTTGWGSPVTVTVAQLNRLTGSGPTVSEEIP